VVSWGRRDDGPVARSQHRFYDELDEWWPLISPPEEYAEEAAEAARHLRSASIPVREVLELGSGGGHNAVHLTSTFAMTLCDLAEPMLEVSRRLNPGCQHHRGDMRTVRLGRQFDAVFVHDAVGYMTTEEDLSAAMTTAYVHCRPGGVALFAPDETAETFVAETSHGGSDGSDGRGVRYLEWSWDPDPHDTSTSTEYVFVLRDTGGDVRVVHEAHRFGLFSRDVWLRLLATAGFVPRTVLERTAEDRPPREFFLGDRPG
jgi:SAM-dependent methyltransferase